MSQVGACLGVTQVQLLDGVTVLGTDNAPGATSTFVVTLNDGAVLALEAKAFVAASEVASTGVRAVKVDLTPPAVAFVSALVDGFQTPAAGASLTWNTALDHAPLTAGFQFHARVQITDAHVDGGAITSLTAVGSAGTVALTPSNGALPLTISGSSPLARDLLDLTVADLDTYVVTVSATDAAGNPGGSSFTAKVDITRPDPISVVQVTVLSKRRVRSLLSFLAVGDNGSTGGPAASYDMRYSRNPITAANVDNACSFRDLYVTVAVPTPAAPGVAQSGQLGTPDKRPYSSACKLAVTFDDGVSASSDPLWYYAVRAVDAVGNVSLLGPGSVAVQTRGQMQLDIDRVKFSTAAGSAFQTLGGQTGAYLPYHGRVVGDVNDDGRPDIVVGSELNGAFCVIYGHDFAPEEVLTTASGANHDCLLSPASIFPSDSLKSVASSIQTLGDINGDGIADFGITGRFGDGAGGFTGEAFALLYLGRVGGPNLASPDLVVRGIQHTTDSPYVGACGVGDFDGLDDGGGVADDIGIGEGGYNRFHVIPGRTSWVPGQARVTINLGFDADRNPANGEPDDSAVRVANRMFSVYGPTFAIGTGLFGAECGAAGNVLPTPAGGGSGVKGDAVVFQSGSADARLFVFPGREYTAGTIVNVSQNIVPPTPDPGFPTAEDLISVRLRQEADVTAQPGFGVNFLANVDVTGDFIPDVVAGCRKRSSNVSGGDGKSVYVFDGARLATLAGTDVRVNVGSNPKVDLSWTGTNGFVLDVSVNGESASIASAGNFDEWYSGSPPVPSTDLLFGNAAGDRIQLRVSHKFGAAIQYGQFPVEDGEFGDIFGAGAFPVGLWITGGVDFNADGKQDIATGGAAGEILIVR